MYDEQTSKRRSALEISAEVPRATVHGRVVELTAAEHAILLALAQQPGVPIAPRALLQAAWGTAWPGPVDAAHVLVSRLRRKLGEDGAQSRFIRTQHGHGYWLDPDGVGEESTVALRYDRSLILRQVRPRVPALGYDPDRIVGTGFAPVPGVAGIPAARLVLAGYHAGLRHAAVRVPARALDGSLRAVDVRLRWLEAAGAFAGLICDVAVLPPGRRGSGAGPDKGDGQAVGLPAR